MSGRKSPVAPVVTSLVAAVAFAAFLAFPNAVPDNTLDASWSAAFAYFFRKRLHAGVDYIFTYGPLGFLLTAYFDPWTFSLKWLYEVSLKAYTVWEIVRLSRLPDAQGKAAAWWRGLIPLAVAAVLWAFSIYPGFVYTTDAWAYVVFLVLATALMVDRNFGVGRVVASAVILAVLSLCKATLTVLALPVIVVCALRMNARATKPPVWQSPLLVFPAVWLALWFLLGQGVANIVPFFVGSFSVASGYNEAGAYATPEYRNSAAPLVAAVVALVCLLIALRIQNDSLKDERREAALRIVYLCFVALTLLIAWKHGFTRGGNHTLIPFLTFGFAASFLWAVLPGGSNPIPRTLLFGAATVCSLFGVLRGDDGWFHRDSQYPPLLAGLRGLFDPVGTATRFNAKHDANKAAFALPEIKRIVGKEPVGIWSYEQGVLFLNDLRYRPHPSFQGYSSYTSYLQQRDLRFWAGDAAPRFLIFKPQTIDSRYPNLDGGPAFAGLLLRYAPVLTENGYFLLERREPVTPLSVIIPARDQAQSVRLSMQTAASYNKWLEVPPALPNELRMVSVTLKPTITGVISRILYKPADVVLAVRQGQGTNPQFYRIPASMARQGFVLNPRLQSDAQVAMLYEGMTDPMSVRQIGVALPLESEPCFEPDADIRFFTVPFGATSPEGNPQ